MTLEPMPPAADHGYTCPRCAAPMLTFQRSGVAVERCTECRGLFLDRGELERLVDMEGGPMRAPEEEPRGGWTGRASGRHDDADEEDDDRWGRRRGRRRRGLLEDLLDAFGD